jgi:uncharacterized protein YdhG (YjbR/CyaY superfamily)
MATTKAAAKKAPAKKAAAKTKAFLSEEEIEAMKATKAERKKGAANGEDDLKAAIAKLTGTDKQIADKLDKIVRANAPNLTGKTWYGLPAWAGADGKAVIFFTPGVKFKERYASIGFGTSAKLDDGNMWQTSFAVLKIGEAEEKKLAAMLKKAVG